MIYCTHALEKKREIIVPNEIIVSEIVARVRPLIYKCVKLILLDTLSPPGKKNKKKEKPPHCRIEVEGSNIWVGLLKAQFSYKENTDWLWFHMNWPLQRKTLLVPLTKSHLSSNTLFSLSFFPMFSLSLSLLFIIVKFYILLKY